jgi:hypothetical protein
MARLMQTVLGFTTNLNHALQKDQDIVNATYFFDQAANVSNARGCWVEGFS